MAGDIPSGSQCDPEWTGFEAQMFDGNWCQDMTISCNFPDRTPARLRSLNLQLANGTTVDASIIYHGNGTVEAKCGIKAQGAPLKKTFDEDTCYGPAYNPSHVYVGPFTYGSAPVERYAVLGDNFLNSTMD